MKRACVIVAIGVWLAACGCNDRDNMRQGARLRPFEATPGSPRLLATNVPPPGVVARAPGPFELTQRPPLTAAVLDRGQVYFNVYCSPCHARDGYGDGLIVLHGYPAPPSFHTEDLRSRDDAHLFNVIERGLGKMPPYGAMIAPVDRWAIVEYVRALQLSQHAPPELVPPEHDSDTSEQGGPS